MFGEQKSRAYIREEQNYGGKVISQILDKSPKYFNPQPSMRVVSRKRRSPKRMKEVEEEKEQISYGELDGKYEKRAQLSLWLSELRRQAPHLNIPEYPPNMPVDELEKVYLAFKKTYFISQNVSTNKRWMLFLFVGLELLGRSMKLPLDKFATNQLKMMEKYDQYLIRLGEKNVEELMQEVQSVEENPLKELIKEIGINVVSILFMNVLSPKLGETESELIKNMLLSVMSNFTEEDMFRKIESLDSDTPYESVPEAEGQDTLETLTKLAVTYAPLIGNFVPSLKPVIALVMPMIAGSLKKKEEPKETDFTNLNDDF